MITVRAYNHNWGAYYRMRTGERVTRQELLCPWCRADYITGERCPRCNHAGYGNMGRTLPEWPCGLHDCPGHGWSGFARTSEPWPASHGHTHEEIQASHACDPTQWWPGRYEVEDFTLGERVRWLYCGQYVDGKRVDVWCTGYVIRLYIGLDSVEVETDIGISSQSGHRPWDLHKLASSYNGGAR